MSIKATSRSGRKPTLSREEMLAALWWAIDSKPYSPGDYDDSLEQMLLAYTLAKASGRVSEQKILKVVWDLLRR